MTFPGSFYIHTVTVTPFKGVGATGDQYSAPVTVACFVEEVSRLLSTGSSEEATSGTTGAFTSSTTLYASPDAVASFPIASNVTLPSGRVGRVVQVNIFDASAIGINLDHIEVHLT